jgi:hypothetical protein
MSSEAFTTPEYAPGELVFETVYSAVTERFQDLLSQTPNMPPYFHYLFDRNPAKPNDVLAHFALTDSYENMRSNTADYLEIGLPVSTFGETSLKRFQEPGERYFWLKSANGGAREGVIVSSDTYDQLFFGAEPVVNDLLTKIIDYEPVPMRRSHGTS